MKPILSAGAAFLVCVLGSGCASSWRRSEVHIHVHPPPGLEARSARIYLGDKLCFVTTNETSVAQLYPGTVEVKVAMEGVKAMSKDLKIAGVSGIQQVDFNLEGLR